MNPRTKVFSWLVFFFFPLLFLGWFFFFPHCFFTDLSIRDAGERDLILETTPALAEQMWCQAASKAVALHEEM